MYRTCDIMAVCMARLLRDGETVFHGVSSHLPLIAVQQSPEPMACMGPDVGV